MKQEYIKRTKYAKYLDTTSRDGRLKYKISTKFQDGQSNSFLAAGSAAR
jgi:hypothetical protein